MDSTADGTAHEDLWRILQNVSDWIRVADAKAGAALAIDGAVLALAAARLRGSQSLGIPAIVALSLAVILAAASVLLAIWTVMPRARGLRITSIAHYGTIAAFNSAVEYRGAALAALTDLDGMVENLSQHIWTFSRVAARKYLLVTWAIRLLASGMLAGVLGLLLP